MANHYTVVGWMDNRKGDIPVSKPTPDHPRGEYTPPKSSDLPHARGVLVHVTDPTDLEVTDHFWVFHLADRFNDWDEVHRLVAKIGRGYGLELVPE